MKSNIEDVVRQYYQSLFFLFVPNICNARCNFCYVRPSFSEKALLSRNTLSRLPIFLNRMRLLGFDTVRLTGGEPTCFSNIMELVRLIVEHGFSYTILSNGLEHDRLVELTTTYKPVKVQLSVHSLARHGDIFGVKSTISEIFSLVQNLKSKDIPVSVNVLYLEENAVEIPDIIRTFRQLGAQEYKVIFPNIPTASDNLRSSYKNTVELLMQKYNDEPNIRFTSLDNIDCLLKARGYASFTLPNFDVFECCATVGETASLKVNSVCDNLEEILLRIRDHGVAAVSFPCTSHINTCPINLRKL